ncbi:MAG: major facilitator transporter [uncultured bacterium]|nr:MAG: major facilitator transporter [uncultured bacterium]
MKKTLILVTSIVFFIELLDTTILYACAIPITHDFKIGAAKISLPIISYLMGTYILIPLSAWLSHRYNRIKIIISLLAAFSLFSIFCGLSSELYIFSACRFLQGITISLCSTIALITLLSVCTQKEMVPLMGSINILALFGTAIGPFLGAFFSYYMSWRIAFMINFPICFLMVISLMSLKSLSFQPSAYQAKLDWLGLSLISLSLVIMSIGLQQLNTTVTLSCLLILSGVTLSTAYLLIWQTRQKKGIPHKKESILELHVFKNPDFLFGILINIIARSAMCGLPILINILLQKLYHFSVIKAGGYLAVIASAAITAKLASSFINQWSVHKSIIFFTGFAALSIAALSPLEWLVRTGFLWTACFLFGLTTSLVYTVMNAALYITLPRTEIANASNIGTIIQQFSIGLGIAIAVGGLALFQSSHGITGTEEYQKTILIFYHRICDFLAFLMLLNTIISIYFNIYRKNNFLSKERCLIIQPNL